MRAFRIVSGILAVLAVGVLAFGYGGNFKWSTSWRTHAQGLVQAPGSGDVGPVVRFDPFLVTEWEDERKRFVSLTFEFEVSDDQGRKVLTSRTSEIRSEILAMLADLQLSDMASVDFEALKRQVQNRVQTLVPRDTIRRVLITEFLTQ